MFEFIHYYGNWCAVDETHVKLMKKKKNNSE